MAVWQFNRGEWTEAYVFLRLLGDGRIYGADANLVKDEQTYIDIVNVIRDEPDRVLVYERIGGGDIIFIFVKEGENVINIVTAPELTEKATLLYDAIKGDSTGKRKLAVPELQDYLTQLQVSSPKANLSESAMERFGSKTDIILTSEDAQDHARRKEGFSIKSHIGSSPTLFNSSQTSGFRFEIGGCTPADMHLINAEEDFLNMLAYIREHHSLQYAGCRNEVFEENLALVDSCMDAVLYEALLISIGYYGGATMAGVKSICEAMNERNPLRRRHPELFYAAKLKDFLFASFAGLTASRLWNGRRKLTGGYIDVSRTGEMLFFRAISDDVFMNYLFEHTYFDRPDRGYLCDIAVAEGKAAKAKRVFTEEERKEITYKDGKRRQKKGDWGYAYEQDGRFFIDINFQIRFK